MSSIGIRCGGSATYGEIQRYVLQEFGLKVSTLYIAQIKAQFSLIERRNYNKGSAGHRVPACPPEKAEAIQAALIHFGMVLDDGLICGTHK